MSEQPDQQAELMEQLRQIAAEAFVRLPAMEQEILTLAAGQKLQVQEISERLSIPESDVLQAMRNAMQSLFDSINQAATAAPSLEEGAG